MIYLLFGLITMVIILFITANIQANSTKFENFTLSSIGTIRDKIKLNSRNKIISTIKYKMKKKN